MTTSQRVRPPDDMLDAVGDTPLARLRRIVPEHSAEVFVKLEYYSPTGSYKRIGWRAR